MTEEQRLILAPVVKAIAQKYFLRTPPSVTFDELDAAGWDGALDFMTRWDASRGVPLKLAAKRRIHGAIQDYLRSLDPLTRGQRADGLSGPVSLELEDALTIPIPDTSALAAFLDIENTESLARLWNRTGIRERNGRILRSHFFRGRPMSEIARTHKLAESRVSQIIKDCLRKLRKRAEELRRKAGRKCPCGNPLRVMVRHEAKPNVRMRRKYCGRECFYKYGSRTSCRILGCNKPAWKQSRSAKRKDGTACTWRIGTLCKFHYRIKQARRLVAYRLRLKNFPPPQSEAL